MMAAGSYGVMANADEAGSFVTDTVVDEVAAENALFTQWAGASAFINGEYSTDDAAPYAPTRYSNYNVLGGLSPQLQGTSNCIRISELVSRCGSSA